MWIAFHNPFKLAFARRAKAINLKQSNPKGVLRAVSCSGGCWNESDPFVTPAARPPVSRALAADSDLGG